MKTSKQQFMVAAVGKTIKWGAVFFVGWLVVSCEEFCEESNRSAMVVNFYSVQTNALLTVSNVFVRAVNNPDTLYPTPATAQNKTPKKDFSQLLLPLDPSADSTVYIIKNNTSPADTIIINYSRHAGFVSSECGCTSLADLAGEIRTTTHSIQKIEVLRPNVSTVTYRENVVNAENIRIYY